MPKYLDLHTVSDGSALALVLREMARYQARTAVAATALTDSSGGTADAEYDLGVVADATNTANSGTSLAGKASTETAMGTVLDALATLYAKANTAATALDLDTLTYSGGGTSGGNTLGAVTVSVTAAATGVPATAWNTFTAAAENAFYQLGCHVNKLCRATGKDELDVSAMIGTESETTIDAISTSTGTAADPGVTKVKADADLLAFAHNAATVAARLNAVIGGAGKPGVVVV
jgi:hypothetical protein